MSWTVSLMSHEVLSNRCHDLWFSLYSYINTLEPLLFESSLPTAIIGDLNRESDGFHVKELHALLQLITNWTDHWLTFMTSGASYMRTIPSEEQVARSSPACFGANLTSVTDVRLSTNECLLIQTLWLRSPLMTFRSNMATNTIKMISIPSNLRVALICNSFKPLGLRLPGY